MAAVSRVGVAFDLMERALEVGDVGMRVASDTWLRWMHLAGKLAIVSAGQGVAAFRGLDTTKPVADAFEGYIRELAALPGKAGVQFGLEWDAIESRPRAPGFPTLLVPDVPHWQAWTRLAGKLAQVSTAWQKKRGRLDRRYAPQLRRVAEMPLQTSRDLAQKVRDLRRIMRPRASDPAETLVSVVAARDAAGAERAVRLLTDHVIDRLEYMAWRPTTPEHEVTNTLAEYGKLLGEATDVAVATGREYDRHADRYGMAWGFSQSSSREQGEIDERLTKLADAHRQRLASVGSRITPREIDQFLDGCQTELGDLAGWPVRAAEESNKAFGRMIRLERKRLQQERRSRARR